MKQILVMMAAVVLVGCGENPTVDVNLRVPNPKDHGCEHVWNNWINWSKNPQYDFFRENDKRRTARLQGKPVPKEAPEYIHTTGDRPVSYQTRTCTKCNMMQSKR